MIPLTRPWIEDAEIAAVADVLRSGMLVQGRAVAAFEGAVAARCGRRHGIAVSSGTAALYLGLQALGIGPGDEVLVPALTWPSPAHAARCLGATVRLVDVHPDEWNVTPALLQAARSSRTKAAVVIDQFGNPLQAGFEDAGLTLLEDAACALGSVFAGGAPCGSLGALACLSFHPRKVLTTGEGGVIVTDDPILAQRLRAARNHGQSEPGIFVEPAVNHRLTELQGALGNAQLARLDDALSLRRRHAEALVTALSDRLTFQTVPAGAQPSYQTLGALLPPSVDRDGFLAACRTRGVRCGRLSYGLHHVGTVPHDGPLPVTDRIVARGIALPLFPQMTDDQRDEVVSVIRELT